MGNGDIKIGFFGSNFFILCCIEKKNDNIPNQWKELLFTLHHVFSFSAVSVVNSK